MDEPKDLASRLRKDHSIQCLVFDFDGVIVSLNTDYPALKKALRRFSLRDIGADIAFDPLITGLERLVALGGEKALGGAYSMIEEFESNCPGRPSVNHPIVDLIGSEAGTKKVAVFSSNTRKTITRLLREIGIEELFDVIVALEDVSRHKPDPEGINKIRESLSMDRDRMIYIGDRAVDMEAGRRAGVKSILIPDWLP